MLQSRLRFCKLVPHASANSELISQTTNVIGNCQDPPNEGYSHHTSTATDHSLSRVAVTKSSKPTVSPQPCTFERILNPEFSLLLNQLFSRK
jgi:hypothetical protein